MSPSSAEAARRWLSEAVAARDLERLKPNIAAAGDRTNDAPRQVRSARALADDDRTLAVPACHDAIRKAIRAHMAALGHRPRSGEEAHRIVFDYARHQLAGVLPQTSSTTPTPSAGTERSQSTATSRHRTSTPTMSAGPRTSRKRSSNAVANDLARQAKASAANKRG